MKVRAWVPCDHEFVCGVLGAWLLFVGLHGAESLTGKVLLFIGVLLVIFSSASWCSRGLHRELLPDAERLRVHPFLGEPDGMIPLEWLAIVLASSLAMYAIVSRSWEVVTLAVFVLAFAWGELMGRRIEVRSERMRRFYGDGAPARHQVLVTLLFAGSPRDTR